jgi:peptidoglycan/xylan/chitin deacetylase (PgdA/CDA1 family)
VNASIVFGETSDFMLSKAALMSAGGTCARTPLLIPLVRPFYRRRANIVYYHGVWRKGSPLARLFGGIDVDKFRNDMTLLSRHFEPVSLDRILRFNQADRKVGKPLVAVTFDDGCDLTRSGATEILDELKIPATTFVVLACVGNRHVMWQHKLSAIRGLRGDDVFVPEFNRVSARVAPGSKLAASGQHVTGTRQWPMDRKDEYADAVWQACGMPPVDEFLEEHRPYVDWRDLDDWRRRGHSVGLHTRTHPFCSRLTSEQIQNELVDAARELRERLDAPAVSFAYPFGNRLPQDMEHGVARRAGFPCMLGINGLSRQGTPPYRLNRVAGEAGLDASMFFRPLWKAARGA